MIQQTLRRIRIFTITTAALALAGLLAAPATGVAQGVGLQVGATAPDVTLADLDGNAVTLRSVAPLGKPALIEFWATWCENCEALQPQLDQIVETHGEAINVVAVAVAVSQTERRVKRHVEEEAHGYPYLWDGQGAAVRAYNAATTSIVILVDAEGKVVYSGVGAGQDLVGEVAKLLGEG